MHLAALRPALCVMSRDLLRLQDLIAPGIALGFYLSIYNKTLIDINTLFIRA